MADVEEVEQALSWAIKKRMLEGCGTLGKVSMIDGLTGALPGTPPQAKTLGFEDCARIAHALGAKCLNLVHINGQPQPIERLAEAFS